MARDVFSDFTNAGFRIFWCAWVRRACVFRQMWWGARRRFTARWSVPIHSQPIDFGQSCTRPGTSGPQCVFLHALVSDFQHAVLLHPHVCTSTPLRISRRYRATSCSTSGPEPGAGNLAIISNRPSRDPTPLPEHWKCSPRGTLGRVPALNSFPGRPCRKGVWPQQP